MNNCFICKISYEKGIGICCSRQCHNIRINTRSRDNDKHVLAAQKKIRDYETNPKLCANCQKFLTYSQYRSNYKFCSRSCGAMIANAMRDQSVYQKQVDTLRVRIEQNEYQTIKKVHWPTSRVSFGVCAVCQTAFRARGNTKYCSSLCKAKGGIKPYRRACKFKISKTTYPELFDTALLEKHGWYRAANHPLGYNPRGATWDHLFRIEDGFRAGVDPDIMSHPANAEMISWEDNFARKNSKLTLDELMQRIDAWKK
jgi:hypothetical protein